MMPACFDERGVYRPQHEVEAGRCRNCRRAVVEPTLPLVEPTQCPRQYERPPFVPEPRERARFDVAA